MKPGRVMCEHHDFTGWQGVVGVTDMLVRRWRGCGLREIRILPPDVAPKDVQHEGWWCWPQEED